MALTVNQAHLFGISFFKGATDYATAEEVRMANNVQSIISGYYRWHWLLTAGTNVAISSGTQDYSIAAADQNTVGAIAEANLLSGSTQLPNLLIWGAPALPKSSTTGQPIAVGLLSATQIRLWPVPGATYTFQWRFYARPVVFTANSQNWQCPDSFNNTVKSGMKWQLLEWGDDLRAPAAKIEFYESLAKLEDTEKTTMERQRN